MALVLKDRVKQTATAPGTGTITLLTTPTGFQAFSAVGNGNTTYFAIVDPTSGAWEVNYGTYTSSGTTLSRNSPPLSSSNAGALTNFTGAVDVFLTYPSENAVWRDTSGVVVQQSFGAITATSAALTTGTVSTTPASNTDIANKLYVDGLVTQGISYHEPVYVESPNTAGNLTATYNNGASGVGATLTNAGTQVALTIDGILMTTTKRVLIYNQTNQTQNGVYTVTTVGTVSTNWVLTRSTDANTYGLRDPNALGYNDAFFVANGDTGAGETYVVTTTGVIVFGTTNITFAQISSSQVYNAGTGLNLSPATTFNISNTGVTANTYGSASAVPVITVNAQGQATGITNTNIAINGTQVSGNITGSAGSVANALTLGTYLTGTSFNGSAAVTATVDATSANTASKVVARDASGNFSAGTITATLSGSSTSATTATNLAGGTANQIPYQTSAGTTSFITAASGTNYVLNYTGSAFNWVAGTISGVSLGSNLNALTLGTYLTGTSYNGSATVTAAVDATSANTASKVVARDASGNFSAGTITAALTGNASTATTATNVSGTVAVANGGTGQTTYTNGQLLIGNTTGNTLTKATLTAGTGISITNSTGSITIASTGSVSAATPTALGTVYGNTPTSGAASSTFYGYQAGNVNTGTANVGVGYVALSANTSGIQNVAVGPGALGSNTTAQSNVAVGNFALYANTDATGNTAVGDLALRNNTTGGTSSSAFGRDALRANTSGAENTAVGAYSLTANTTASRNTAMGYQSGFKITTGADNTALGYGAGSAVTTGTGNTLVGTSAAPSLTTGSYNTCIGWTASVSAVAASNQIVIGANVTSQGNSYITMGSSTAKVYNNYAVNATWTQTSDARLKNIIGPDTLGLSFINRLNPIKYTWKAQNELPVDNPYYNETNSRDIETVIHGFVAQEIKAAMDAENCTTFNGWDEGPDGIQAISREMLVSPLVKAIQELSAKLDALEAKHNAYVASHP